MVYIEYFLFFYLALLSVKIEKYQERTYYERCKCESKSEDGKAPHKGSIR